MGKHERFYDVPSGRHLPRNREVYEMAKAPFGWLWQFVAIPMLAAFSIAMAASVVLGYMAVDYAKPASGWMSMIRDDLLVAGVWGLGLSAVFVLVAIARGR